MLQSSTIWFFIIKSKSDGDNGGDNGGEKSDCEMKMAG